MSKITCKPCFAFDALAAIALREANLNGFRNDIPYIKDQIEKNFERIKIPGSDSYFRLFTDCYSIMYPRNKTRFEKTKIQWYNENKKK